MKTQTTFIYFLAILLLVGNGLTQQNAPYDYDILIKNGKIFDGSLKNPFKADVAIKDGHIAQIDKGIKGSAGKTINAKGLHIAPGFIDLHTHVDRNMYFPENRACFNYLKQGVTSIVAGQCGSSAWPIFEKAEDQIRRWTEEGVGPNAALLVGHGTVRQIVMGMENREPTPEELEAMKALIQEAMEQGAHGFSTGLIYRPGSYSNTEEVIELVKVIEPYNGIYHSHIRNENARLLEAVQELIQIAEETGVRSHISHFKVMGKSNWGSVQQACTLIEEGRARGLKITADQYPYQFANNYPYRSLVPGGAWRGDSDIDRITSDDITSLFDYLRDDELIELYSKVTPYIPLSDRHKQFLDGLPRKRLVSFVSRNLMSTGDFQGPTNTRDRMLFVNRMKQPEEAEKICEKVRDFIRRSDGAEQMIIAICVNEAWEGKSLKDIAAMENKPVEDMAIELELMNAKMVPLRMGEDDIEYIMKKDYVGTGSDGASPFYGIGGPHIRSYSTFLHKIKKYGLERKTASLPHIIRSQTSLPAEIMNWNDRGWIKQDYKADIVLLDIKHIQNKTSISNPHQYSEGVKYLIINGKIVIDDGRFNGTLAGEVIQLKQ